MKTKRISIAYILPILILLFPGNSLAAVAYDASSESHTGTSGNTSAASFSWTHTPSGTPRGVLVYTFNTSSTADDATSVTYGGVSMTPVTGGRAVDTATETGDSKAWFLGGNIPTGAQTVVVNRTNNTDEMYAVAITVTASLDTEVTGTTLQQENQAPAEAAVTDGSVSNSNSMRFAGAFYGGANPPAVGANTTSIQTIDFGQRTVGVARETTAGTGSRSVGFSDASDDWANVLLAVRERSLSPTVVLNTPTNGSASGATPTLNFTGTDSNGQSLEYNVQIDSNTFDFAPLSQTSRRWRGISIDSSNQNVYAAVTASGDLYKQTGGSGSFVALGQTARDWTGIAVDSTNHNVYATAQSGDIYKQTGGSGSFVALGQTARLWQAVAIDNTSHNVYAVDNGGFVYAQTLGSGNFNQFGQTARDWAGVAVDQSNHNVYAVDSGNGAGGDIYEYIGSDFLPLGQAIRVWVGITVDSNHNVYAITNSGDIYEQVGGTGDFLPMGQTSRTWESIAVDTTTHNVYATEDSGDIYKQTATTPLLSKFSTVDAGFTAGHPFGSGSAIDFIVQAADALAAGTYYWRVAAIDPSGSNATGTFSGAQSFIVSASAATPRRVMHLFEGFHIKIMSGRLKINQSN